MSLDGAAGGHVLGIEVEDDPLAAVLIEVDGLALLIGQSEGGGGLADFGHGSIVGGETALDGIARKHENGNGDHGDGGDRGFRHGNSPNGVFREKVLPRTKPVPGTAL